MAEFSCFVQLAGTLTIPFVTKPATGIPTNADADPTYRIYGASGSDKVMNNGSSTAAKRHTGTITNVANNGSGVCRATCSNHGLYDGQRVTVSGVGGAIEANGTWIVDVIDANTFDLTGSSAPSAFSSNGSFNVTGLYYLSHAIVNGDGYSAGQSYSVVIDYAISSTALQALKSFQVS